MIALVILLLYYTYLKDKKYILQTIHFTFNFDESSFSFNLYFVLNPLMQTRDAFI